jgi:hypothetical protein
MAIVYALIRGVPLEKHLPSFQEFRPIGGSRLLSFDEYVSAVKENSSNLGVSKRWNGLFWDVKDVVRERALVKVPYAHVRGRYDRLSNELANEFQARIEENLKMGEGDRHFSFEGGHDWSDQETVGLITVMMFPERDPNFLAFEIQKKLRKGLEEGLSGRVDLIYSASDFARSFPFTLRKSNFEIDGLLGIYPDKASLMDVSPVLNPNDEIFKPDEIHEAVSVFFPVPENKVVFFANTMYNHNVRPVSSE